MKICPKCKKEYSDAFSACSKCNYISLVKEGTVNVLKDDTQRTVEDSAEIGNAIFKVVRLSSHKVTDKINAIKEVRSFTNLNLGEAKKFIDGTTTTIKKAATKREIEKLKKKFEAMGIEVKVIQPVNINKTSSTENIKIETNEQKEAIKKPDLHNSARGNKLNDFVVSYNFILKNNDTNRLDLENSLEENLRERFKGFGGSAFKIIEDNENGIVFKGDLNGFFETARTTAKVNIRLENNKVGLYCTGNAKLGRGAWACLFFGLVIPFFLIGFVLFSIEFLISRHYPKQRIEEAFKALENTYGQL